MKFNPNEKCDGTKTQCSRCNNPNGPLACDSGYHASMQEFQSRVGTWALELFGEDIATNVPTRVFRFLEEALELAQSLGCTDEQARKLVDYVFGRPVGDPRQEVGGTMVTLGALCAATKIDMGMEAWVEQTRCEQPEVKAKILKKQASKIDRFGVLPGSAA